VQGNLNKYLHSLTLFVTNECCPQAQGLDQCRLHPAAL